MAEEDRTTETTSSLFPAYIPHQPPQALASGPTTTASVPQWLQSTSFTADISVINDAVSKYNLPNVEEDEEEKAEELNANKRRPQYEIVPSSPSEAGASSSDEEHRKRRKKKKKRRKESGGSRASYSYAATLSATSRKPGVQKWTSSSSISNEKEYYFDSRGDRDNLAFGCIYRMDVARYKLYNKKNSDHNHFRLNKGVGRLERDSDIDALDTNLRSGGRYWSAKYSAIERHKNLKRFRILAHSKPVQSSVSDYIPLLDEDSTGGLVSSEKVVEESWEDSVLRKTKEFNKRTRERPQDESVWLAFAEFQDKVASMQPHKGARLQTLEKKISILEKATEINPDSEDLILSLMNAYQSRDSIDVLIRRWEKILTFNSGSYKLWREFLRVVQGEFSRFKVSEMRRMYANAIQALAGACIKQHRQVHPSGSAAPTDPEIVQLELSLVDVFLGLCRLEWQAGYQELATALFQAEIEYCLFCPLVTSEQSKRRLFEHFWSSSGARIGEDGALGWSTWLEKEEEERQRLINEEALSTAEEEGGWTGWFQPSSKTEEIEMAENTTEKDVVEGLDDGSDEKDVEEKDDVESLLKALGIDAADEGDIKIKDTKTWTKWSKAEMARDFDQWMPLRADSDRVSHDGAPDDAEDDEQILRIILFEDVSDYLFSLNSEEARFSLVSQYIDFFEGRIAQWTCTNNANWLEKIHSLDSLPYSLVEDLRKLHDVLTKKLDNPLSVSLELLLNSPDESNMRSNMMRFLRNAILLCLKAFPQNYILERAALVAEELSNTTMDLTSCSVTPCRSLAKTLLKNNRQDVLLCGVYAQREAFFGNIDHSRKVFDMALSSIEGLPLDVKPNVSLLYLWYAEVELANNSSENAESLLRAMHILSCFGSGAKYSPFKGQPSSLQKLRARQGFKDHMKMLSSTWARGIIDDNSAALICSSALFEELTFGWASALEILENSFTMVLPERRRHSRQLEFLFDYYVRMLYKNRMELKSSKVWEAIVKGLHIYPFNPQLHKALVEISHLYTSPNKLRWTFDDYCQKKPSVITLIYALSFEMSIGGSQHRIRGLFERALEDDKLHKSVILWRCFIEYERTVTCNISAAKRVFFRAIHACPWSKKLWLDGFLKLDSILTVKELSDLQEVMRDKELYLRTDIYEILLQDEMDT
ncbi:protein nrde2 homolog [Phtheirospermum japonicum]|uniref:Protein nrde2 homolog n=1 Tax=Phtheirospermum japonicum TaxID=374723 RepID=A0A830BXA1_9LAMI|nr:protein nrde2 homolog [Phtheirospermum japonicum]